MASLRSAGRTGFALLAAVAIAWLFVANVRDFYFLTDDAFISFRYARHLVEGQGLVWNPGERVEGYTNFLWVLLMASAPLEYLAGRGVVMIDVLDDLIHLSDGERYRTPVYEYDGHVLPMKSARVRSHHLTFATPLSDEELRRALPGLEIAADLAPP